MSTSKQTLSKSFFWSFLEQSGSTIANLIIQIVLARLLAPDAFGVMAILLVISSILSAIAESGFGMALVQKANTSPVTFSTAFWISMGLALVLYGISFLTAPLIARVYSMPDLTLYLRILTILLFFQSFNSIQRAYLQKAMDFKALFRANLLSIIAGGIAGIAAAFSGFGVWALIVQTSFQTIIACCVMLIQIPWKPSFAFDKTEGKALFNYGWKISCTGILNTLYTGVSELIIGKTTTQTDLGLYSQGRKWPSGVIAAATQAIQNVLFPAFSELQNDRENLKLAFKKSLVTSAFIALPIGFLAAIIAKPLIILLIGDVWIPCVPIFQLTCLNILFTMPQVINLRIYMALGYSDLYLKLQIIKVVTGIAFFSIVAITTHNIYLVALATFIHIIFSVIVVDMQPAKRIHGISRSAQLRLLTPIFILSSVACISTVAAILVLNAIFTLPAILQLVISPILFCAIYLAGAKLFQFKELSYCLSMIKALIQK